MKSSSETPARSYAKGIGDAVADRTINRKITRAVEPYIKTVELPRRDDMALDHEVDEWCRSNNLVIESYHVEYGDDLIVRCLLNVVGHIEVEKWEDVAARVATGNALLHPEAAEREVEFNAMHHHLRQASILMSGRHLQHGDETQPLRNMEVFTNCSTAASTFLTFYLLLNGSGVGRSYDNEMIRADLNSLPIVVCTIDMMHKDVQTGEINALDMRTAKHLYAGPKWKCSRCLTAARAGPRRSRRWNTWHGVATSATPCCCWIFPACVRVALRSLVCRTAPHPALVR